MTDKVFNVGDFVDHKTFGRGKVVKVDGDVLWVRFFKSGLIKKQHKLYAPLSRVANTGDEFFTYSTSVCASQKTSHQDCSKPSMRDSVSKPSIKPAYAVPIGVNATSKQNLDGVFFEGDVVKYKGQNLEVLSASGNTITLKANSGGPLEEICLPCDDLVLKKKSELRRYFNESFKVGEQVFSKDLSRSYRSDYGNVIAYDGRNVTVRFSTGQVFDYDLPSCNLATTSQNKKTRLLKSLSSKLSDAATVLLMAIFYGGPLVLFLGLGFYNSSNNNLNSSYDSSSYYEESNSYSYSNPTSSNTSNYSSSRNYFSANEVSNGSSSSFSASATDWSEACSCLGVTGYYKGPVKAVDYASSSDGCPTFIDLGVAYPDYSRLSLVIWGEDRSAFSQAPERLYSRGDTLVVYGTPYSYNGATYIEVSSPDQITKL